MTAPTRRRGSTWAKRNDWRAAIFAPGNNLRPLTRLVLVALSNYSNDKMTCWPSEKTLAGSCGLSERAVRTHLQLAEKAGWIERYQLKRPGRAWYVHGYRLRLPGEQPAPHAARQAPRPANGGATTGTARTDGRHGVPPNSFKELFHELRVSTTGKPKTERADDAAKTAAFLATQLEDPSIETAYLDCAARVGTTEARRAVNALLAASGAAPNPQSLKELLMNTPARSTA